LAYVTGSQPFWTLDLKVTSDTLVPRPDTEILVETVLNLNSIKHANIVDLGTGTGAIALALASERPEWQVTATDIYAPTLDVAKENARSHGLHHVKFACGAWFEALEQQQFDLIVSNPPYIDPEDVHMQALANRT
jgi:release factor glutamine methyltransferase